MALPGNWRDIVKSAMANATAGDKQTTSGTQSPSLNFRLALDQAQQKQLQRQVASLTKQASALKGKTDKNSKKLQAQVAANLKLAQDRLGAVGKRIVTTQNSIYEKSGQYEKLLSGANRDAFLALETVFKQYGLESLAGKIYNYVKNGYSSDTISILLQDTKEYKQRFAANDLRVKAGLPVLSPADYINTENAYRQLMRQSGLPEGFYDSNKDFTDMISRDVSPTELQSRVDMATQATTLANPYYKQALNQIGIDDGHLAAYFLDPDRSIPLLQKAAATAQAGAAALQSGLTFDQTYAEQLATMGISADQAREGYQQVAGQLGTMQALGTMYGEGWNQRSGEEAAFGTAGGVAASNKQNRLLSQERGAFGGGTGAAQRQGGLTQAGGAQ